ncbi:MAG: hypothetical protein NT121_04240 [Chloroflexi bacterium]|nr:hypothetical protein [Chloroflexota bacterium]
MPGSLSRIREIAEGEEADEIRDFIAQKKRFIGTSIIVANRPGASDAIIYQQVLKNILEFSIATVIFPLIAPSELPLEIKIETITTKQTNFLDSLVAGKAYRIQASTQKTVINFILKSLRKFLPREDKTVPYIFAFDTLQKWDEDLENLIRYLIREAPIANLGIWIHCPLGQVPLDLYPAIGNVMAVWPSIQEIEFLQTHLPAGTVKIEEKEYLRGTWIFSNQLIKGKGWTHKKYQLDA